MGAKREGTTILKHGYYTHLPDMHPLPFVRRWIRQHRVIDRGHG